MSEESGELRQIGNQILTEEQYEQYLARQRLLVLGDFFRRWFERAKVSSSSFHKKTGIDTKWLTDLEDGWASKRDREKAMEEQETKYPQPEKALATLPVSITNLNKLIRAYPFSNQEAGYILHLANADLSRKREVKISLSFPRLMESYTTSGTACTVIDLLWNILRWNEPASALVRDFSTLPPEERILIWLMSTDPEAVKRIENHPLHWQRMIIFFRLTSVPWIGTPEHNRLITRLCQTSEFFKQEWEKHNVKGEVEKYKVFHHPVIGEIKVEQMAHPGNEESSGIYVILHIPVEEDGSRKKIQDYLKTLQKPT